MCNLKNFVPSPIPGTHSKLVARFWFKRRLGYAFLQIYIPTIMLVVLSWLSFWIPEDSVPARVALGSTTVLSVVTFTGSFRSSLPKVWRKTAILYRLQDSRVRDSIRIHFVFSLSVCFFVCLFSFVFFFFLKKSFFLHSFTVNQRSTESPLNYKICSV